MSAPKTNRNLPRFLSGTALTTLLLASGTALYSGMEQQALAQDYYWNGPTGVFGDGSTFTAGAGTWSAGGNAYWTNDPSNNNPTPVTWPNGAGLAAHFEGPNQGYTSITIDGAVDFEKLYLGNQNGNPNDTNWYVLNGPGTLNMNPSAGEDVTIIGQAGKQQAIFADIVGPNDLYFQTQDGTRDAGQLGLFGNKSYTGTTYIKSGRFNLGGAAPGNAYANGSIPGDVVISDNASLKLWAGTSNVTVTNTISSEVQGPTTARLSFNGNVFDVNTMSRTNYRITFNGDASKFVGRTIVRANLAGSGSVGGPVEVREGVELYNQQGSTLTLGTSVKLDTAVTVFAGTPFEYTLPAAAIAADLNAANAGKPLFATSGDFDVSQGTFQITVAGPQLASVYNIIQYGGQLIQTPGTIFSKAPTISGLPGSSSYRLDIIAPTQGPQAGPGMLRLLVYDANNEITQYWNGGAAAPDYTSSPLTGGSGTWNTSLSNWTDQTGQNSSTWANSVGIFAGTGGTVDVVNTPGFDRLAFNTGGYDIQGGAGDALLLSPYSATSGVIEVANSGQKTSIGVDIGNGTNYNPNGPGSVVDTLEKTGSGTLVFRGTKTYTGLTTVSTGTLQLGENGIAGGLTGGATVASGAALGGSGSIGADVVINTGATLFADQTGTLAIAGDLAFQAGTTLEVGLTAPATTAMFTSNTLTLGGPGATTINVVAAGAPQGTYALISSATAPGAPDPAGQFALGTNIPGGSTVSYSPVGHIYLNINSGGPSGPAFVYWDGTVTSGTAPIAGGTGTWNTFDVTNENWGDADPPTAHAVWKQGDIAIFTGNAGTVTVQTNSGADPVEVGGLQFAQSGYTIGGDALVLTPVNLTNLAEIAVGPGAATLATIQSELGGALGINKTAAGELVLTGDNSYAGGTQLTGGVLSVGKDSNLGAATSDLTFAGGTLKATDSFSTARAISIDRHGGTINVVNSGDTLIASGKISDEAGDTDGTLIKTGAGTLTLTGTNDYSGDTAIRQGTISVSMNENLGAPSGDVLLDGGRLSATAGFTTARDFQLTGNGGTILIADSANTLSATGLFTDATNQAGSLTKTGDGTLVMTGDNSYTGQTTIAGGTLQLGDNSASGSLAGDVAVEANARFDVLRSTDWIFSGILSGAGRFAQTGAGTTTLAADSSSFAGTTAVINGGLSVTGRLGGMTTVGGAGLLSGTGMLERVAMIGGGRVTAGTATSIDTLSVSDTLSFAPDSDLLVNVVSQNTLNGLVLETDLIDAGGAVTISGGTITVDASEGRVVEGTMVTILSSSDSVTLSDADGDGTAGFDPDVASTNAFVDAEVGYTANTVFLTLKDLTQGGTTLCVPGLTANQCDTANGIDSLGPNNPLYGVITGLPKGALGPSLDQLSGEGYSSIASAMVDGSRYVRDATNTRLRQSNRDPLKSSPSLVSGYAADDTMPEETLAGDDPGIAAWMTAYGSWNRYDATEDTAEMKSNIGGVFIGVDTPVFDDIRFGAVVGYGSSSYDMNANLTSATSNDWTLGLYGGGTVDNWGINFGTSYTWHDISASRQVVIPGLSEQENAGYNSGTYQIYGDFDYMFALASNVDAGPFLDAAYVNQRTDGFSETGGIAALDRDSSNMNTGFTTLGLRTSYTLESEAFTGQVVASAGWRRGYGDLTGAGTLAFPGGSAFDITGAAIARDQAVINVGLQTSINENFDVEVNYIGLFASDYQSQNVVGRLNLRF